MNLAEMLNDMTARYYKVEKNHYSQIGNLKAEIETVNNNYEIMKIKPHLAVQNILIGFLSTILYMLICYFVFKISPTFFSNLYKRFPQVNLVCTAIAFILPVVAVTLNLLRARRKYSKQLIKADSWWEQTGKTRVVELNNSINSIKNEAENILNLNPIHKHLKEAGWNNSEDCYGIYKITVLNKSNSLHDVFILYDEKLERDFEKEEEKKRHVEILEELEKVSEESVRLREELEYQGRCANFDRSIIEM